MSNRAILRLRLEGDSDSILKLLNCKGFEPTKRWKAGQRKLPRRTYEFDGVEYERNYAEENLPEAGKLIEDFLKSEPFADYRPEDFKWNRSLLSLIYDLDSRPCLYFEDRVIALIRRYSVDFDIDFCAL